MEAVTLKKKKTGISKGKIKKTIKNVICRPDPIYWPVISEMERKELESKLNKYHIIIPEFKKPHWNELKNIPKNERPKPPPLKKVEGLIFGLTECRNLLNNKQLAALILEATINPKTIVQPLLEICRNTQVPVICFTGLKKISVSYFGISTSCLGIKTGFLTDITKVINQISNHHKLPDTDKKNPQTQEKGDGIEIEQGNAKDVDLKNSTASQKNSLTANVPCYPYLYRTNKRRVFVPTDTVTAKEVTKKFVGQDFIEFSNSLEKVQDSKAYMKMIVKRISNNPNRVKMKE